MFGDIAAGYVRFQVQVRLDVVARQNVQSRLQNLAFFVTQKTNQSLPE